MQPRLEDPCRFLKGVGPRRAVALENLGIRTVEDLLLHAPRSYMDRSRLQRISELNDGDDACLSVRVESVHVRPPWRGRRSVQATVSDATGRLRVTWFGAWVRGVIQVGNEMLLAGPVVKRRGRLEMRQPEFESMQEANQQAGLHAGRIVPFYPLTRGVTQKWLRQIISGCLESHRDAIEEFLPAAEDWMGRAEAIRALHFPESMQENERARQRLKYEELFLFELLLARKRQRYHEQAAGIALDLGRGLHDAYRQSLSFELTGAQDRVLDEIYADLASGRCMQRLVQGDVGSGKTVVAMMSLLVAIGNGYQGVLMVPTESLALQHAERLMPACVALGIRMDVLVGSRSEKDKKTVRAKMKSGDIDLVIGTHALIQDSVEWHRLGLAVVDEQHRFGVLQRGALQKAANHSRVGPPHVLVLSATPIPRSLALTLFGDLDVSRLDEKPPGRQPVATHVVPIPRRSDMWNFVRQGLDRGHQAYVVLPLIEESEKLDLRAATDEYEHLRRGELRNYRLGLLHGKLPSAEKDKLLRDFQKQNLQLLVATTVVEVGIDVRNASLMIIYHPERFGLSSLHQLRGRVGRGEVGSYCFLLPGAGASVESEARLEEFCRTQDGFHIAELDLRLRGPGDFLGTRQHGLPTLRFADLARDFDVLEKARQAAFSLVSDDAHLEAHGRVKKHLETHYREHEALAEIG